MFFGQMEMASAFSCTTDSIVSIAKPWLICDYHGLTTVTIVFGFIVKPSLIFVRVVLLSALAP